MNTNLSDFHIENLTHNREAEARNLILEGFLDYFESIDHSLNPDVYNLMEYYSQPCNIFKVGLIHSKVVSTGGLIIETEDTARIVRVSVDAQFRRTGLASRMISALEKEAYRLQLSKISIETYASWKGPILLYKKFGYKVYDVDKGLIHFVKYICND